MQDGRPWAIRPALQGEICVARVWEGRGMAGVMQDRRRVWGDRRGRDGGRLMMCY